jgi:hypothetical protein
LEESFDLVAQTRANYYTPGSPVQFVRVELLRGAQSGDNAVCLTFKNVSQVTLTALDVRFKCKNVAGEILCEDSFDYRDLQVQPGELFGMDDAVFITQEPIASVDVILKNVYNEHRVVRLENVKRVRLPAPRRMPEDIQSKLAELMGRRGLRYMPQVLETGWYCACGAFHPKEEDTVYCSECGCDRILLQNALNNLMQPTTKAAEPQSNEMPLILQAPESSAEPTRVAGGAGFAAAEQPAEHGTRTFDPPHTESATQEEPESPAEQEEAQATSAQATMIAPTHNFSQVEQVEEPFGEDEEEEPGNALAENIIRWVPPFAALICAGVALSGFVYCRFLL